MADPMIKNLPRARSEMDITRVSETLSTGSIPVGRTRDSILSNTGLSAFERGLIAAFWVKFWRRLRL